MTETQPRFDPNDPHDRHMSELDLGHGMHASAVRKTGGVIVIAVFLLGLFNAQGLAKWAQKLPENDVADQVVLATLDWEAWMKDLGTARVFAAVRRAFYRLREL